jgi:hypothetical protein
MRIVGSLLVLVIVIHSQCLNACPVALFLSLPSAAIESGSEQPPCHHQAGPVSKTPQNSPDHESTGCGFGLAVESKLAAKLRMHSQFPVFHALVVAANGLGASPILGTIVSVFSPPALTSFSAPAQSFVLRI